MDPIAIVGIAVGVGAIVYALSLRTGAEQALPVHPVDDAAEPVSESRRRRRRTRDEAADFGFSASSADEPETETIGGLVYVPVLASPGPRWRDRLAGVIGLVAVVVVAAALVAVAIYQAGHVANRMIEEFLGR